MTEMRNCLRCGCDKPADREHWYFSKHSGPISPCKNCRLQRQRERYKSDPDYRSGVCEYQRKRRRNPTIKASRRDYDKERYLVRKSDPDYKAWRREYAREYNRERYRNDPKVNLDRRVKGALAKSLRSKGARKTSPKADLLGWTIDELINHLEPLFEQGMSWQNMEDWHIDHIIPLSSIMYTSADDPMFKIAWSLGNLAPLWAKDNQEKLANINWTLPAHYSNPRLRAMYDYRDTSLVLKDAA